MTRQPPPSQALLDIAGLVFLHTVAVQEFGGSHGILDRGRLEAALARPLSGFGGRPAFRTPFTRAAALGEALIASHGFVDGNKRTAVYAMAYWLEREGYRLSAGETDLVDAMVAIAMGEMDAAQLASWLKSRSGRRSNH